MDGPPGLALGGPSCFWDTGTMTSDGATRGHRPGRITAIVAVLLAAGCAAGDETPRSTASPKPSMLLVTFDTTRADAIGPDARGVQTPAFNAVAAAGLRFRQAYAPVPETLPSHVSMLTGLYPGGHGIHENARTLSSGHPLAAERLKAAGYRTAAFVSSFTLAGRFGLARGFDVYDDRFPAGLAERDARTTTDAAVAWLASQQAGPVFLWVHYFDPHHPYLPPEPFRSQFAQAPYLGEVAFADAQLGRLVEAFDRRPGPRAVVVTADHGEGLGDHGEMLHGNLVYQSTMHVPLVVRGPGVEVAVSDRPVSIRRVYHTVLQWAGLEAAGGLQDAPAEVVMGEAMRPFLAYGWQPQVMAVDERVKSILAGRIEAYDVRADPGETRDLAALPAPPPVPPALRDYPVPSTSVARAPDTLGATARQDLASLGYVSAAAAPIVRKDAPRPADMTALFGTLDRASGLFVEGRYREAVPLLGAILRRDPANLDALLRLATAYSLLGQRPQASATFERAVALAPDSLDVRLYLAAHYARGPEWPRAEPLLEQVLTVMPDRLAALEALAAVRIHQGRLADAVDLRERAAVLSPPSPAQWAAIGALAMEAGRTETAIRAFEAGRAGGVGRDLELGVLYLAARRVADARDALDRALAARPGDAMALFKRAQVSVLLGEADRADRIERARRGADATTRELVAREALFAAGR